MVAELARFGIIADDSAGEPLTETPPATFLRLIARAVADGLAPVPLLAMLKHPLAALGLPPAACRAAARALELACLRGPRPAARLNGVRLALAQTRGGAPAMAAALLDRLGDGLLPLARVTEGYAQQGPATLLSALAETAEALTATDAEGGAARLWSGEEGEALATLIAEALPALETLPDASPAVLPGLLDALLEGHVVRSRRATRGMGAGAALHPRISIWGLVEARLQSAEVIVLGSLVEGVWPPSTDPGPWLSRRMRAEAGLPSPEEIIGQAAHDFVATACAAPRVVLSAPRRLGGAPAVPARWLKRLQAMLAGTGRALPAHPALGWVRALDQPAGAPQPVPPPAPCPAVRLRPRKLSITEIETWLADPYAIHAKHILRLRELDPLDQATDAADYGQLVHAGLHLFLAEAGAGWRPDAPARLAVAMELALGKARLRPALANWWRPRLLRIAEWIAVVENERRPGLGLAAIGAEIKGDQTFAGPAGPFFAERPGRPDRAASGRDLGDHRLQDRRGAGGEARARGSCAAAAAGGGDGGGRRFRP